MIQITSKADLNRAVATAAFCPEPPLSKRRAIHGSGAWRFIPGQLNGTAFAGHWEPAKFATEPAASYALRYKMRERGYTWAITARHADFFCHFWRGYKEEWIEFGGTEHIASALATLRALGVEFKLVEGWDK